MTKSSEKPQHAKGKLLTVKLATALFVATLVTFLVGYYFVAVQNAKIESTYRFEDEITGISFDVPEQYSVETGESSQLERYQNQQTPDEQAIYYELVGEDLNTYMFLNFYSGQKENNRDIPEATSSVFVCSLDLSTWQKNTRQGKLGTPAASFRATGFSNTSGRLVTIGTRPHHRASINWLFGQSYERNAFNLVLDSLNCPQD